VARTIARHSGAQDVVPIVPLAPAAIDLELLPIDGEHEQSTRVGNIRTLRHLRGDLRLSMIRKLVPES